MKTALRPENFDERSAVVVKKEKCAVFKFILRLYYVPARFSLRLRRLTRLPRSHCVHPVLINTAPRAGLGTCHQMLSAV